jgi:hypothetical protein
MPGPILIRTPEPTRVRISTLPPTPIATRARDHDRRAMQPFSRFIAHAIDVGSFA